MQFAEAALVEGLQDFGVMLALVAFEIRVDLAQHRDRNLFRVPQRLQLFRRWADAKNLFESLAIIYRIFMGTDELAIGRENNTAYVPAMLDFCVRFSCLLHPAVR